MSSVWVMPVRTSQSLIMCFNYGFVYSEITIILSIIFTQWIKLTQFKIQFLHVTYRVNNFYIYTLSCCHNISLKSLMELNTFEINPCGLEAKPPFQHMYTVAYTVYVYSKTGLSSGFTVMFTLCIEITKDTGVMVRHVLISRSAAIHLLPPSL